MTQASSNSSLRAAAAALLLLVAAAALTVASVVGVAMGMTVDDDSNSAFSKAFVDRVDSTRDNSKFGSSPIIRVGNKDRDAGSIVLFWTC